MVSLNLENEVARKESVEFEVDNSLSTEFKAKDGAKQKESFQIQNQRATSIRCEPVTYSYRRISTGKIREAARAGISVAATLMARAAAAIHMPSSTLVWNGT